MSMTLTPPVLASGQGDASGKPGTQSRVQLGVRAKGGRGMGLGKGTEAGEKLACSQRQGRGQAAGRSGMRGWDSSLRHREPGDWGGAMGMGCSRSPQLHRTPSSGREAKEDQGLPGGASPYPLGMRRQQGHVGASG